MALAGIPKQVREGIIKSENMSGKLSFSFFPKYHSDSSLAATDGGSKYGSDVTPPTLSSSSENCSAFECEEVASGPRSAIRRSKTFVKTSCTHASCTHRRGSRPIVGDAMHGLIDDCEDGRGRFGGGGTTCDAIFGVVPVMLRVTIFARFANFALIGSSVIFCPCICNGQPSID